VDWAKAIERNREALAAIVAALFAVLGLQADAVAAGRISRAVHSNVFRILRPAESALRRLIFIAARGLVVKSRPARPMPKDRKIVRKCGGDRNPSFQLFDPRKRFDVGPRPPPYTRNPPRIWSVEPAGPGAGSVFADDPFDGLFARDPRVAALAMFRPRPPEPPPPPDRSEIDAGRLARRLLAFKLALADIPKQARRLARLRRRREEIQKKRPTYTAPIRQGHPPGHRKKPVHEVDHVLVECQWLARDAMRADTS
jgi:hypothetical protein